jgi:hypothetical protein
MAAPRVDPATLRTVHVITEGESFKALYYDRESAALRPNLVVVEPDGSGGFEINEVGLKGDPLDPRRKLAVVWGDSVVFGSGRGWVCLLDRLAPGYQFLNGGLDGDPYANILRRASEFNRRHPVALNLLMLGWHPFVPSVLAAPPSRRSWTGFGKKGAGHPRRGNENIRADLTGFLEAAPNTVVLTMPTALNRRIIDCDLSSRLVQGDDETGFRFLGNNPYRVEAQRQGFEHIVERNAIAREVCARLGVCLVDLFAALDTERLPDFREHFVDLLHLRPRSYPLVAERIYDEIKDLLT